MSISNTSYFDPTPHSISEVTPQTVASTLASVKEMTDKASAFSHIIDEKMGAYIAEAPENLSDNPEQEKLGLRWVALGGALTAATVVATKTFNLQALLFAAAGGAAATSIVYVLSGLTD